jgi:hypothetical protein
MLLTALLSLTALAAAVPQPIETHLRTTGSWSFSDGSSVYTFADDGGFTLAPSGMSGRTVTGTWTTADWSRFEIDGQWSWVNGLSPAYDFRHLSLHVSAHGSEPDAPVYAVIESLTPQTVRAFAWAGLKTVPAKPSDEITLQQAQDRQTKGEAYYLAHFDDSGRLVWLEKRLNHATMFRTLYRYDGNTAVRVEPGRTGAPTSE